MSSMSYADPTVNYYLAPGDVLVTCPYFGHKVLKTRFQGHLSKCSTNYAKLRQRDPSLEPFVPCGYNYSHHVKAKDLGAHLQGCESFKLFEMSQRGIDYLNYQQGAALQPKSEPVQVNVSPSGKSTSCKNTPGLSRENEMEKPIVKNCLPSAAEESSIFQDGDNEDEGMMTSSKSYDTSYQTSKSMNTSNATPTSYTDPKRATKYCRLNASEDWESELEAKTLPEGTEASFDMKEFIGTKYTYFIPPGMTKKERIEYRKKMIALKDEEDRYKKPKQGGGPWNINMRLPEEEDHEWDDPLFEPPPKKEVMPNPQPGTSIAAITSIRIRSSLGIGRGRGKLRPDLSFNPPKPGMDVKPPSSNEYQGYGSAEFEGSCEDHDFDMGRSARYHN